MQVRYHFSYEVNFAHLTRVCHTLLPLRGVENPATHSPALRFGDETGPQIHANTGAYGTMGFRRETLRIRGRYLPEKAEVNGLEDPGEGTG